MYSLRELQEKEVAVSRPPLATAVFLRPTSPEVTIIPFSKEQARTEDKHSQPNHVSPAAAAAVLPRDPRPIRATFLPPKELPQAELNRVFTDELLQAKSRLRASGGTAISSLTSSTSGSRSQGGNDDDDEGVGRGEGVPPPPPPPVLPPAMRVTKSAVVGGPRSQLPPPAINPREELLLAIRNVGGARGLRKTRD